MIYIRQCSETRFPHLKINGKIYMLIEKKALIAHWNARYHWNRCNSGINIAKSVSLGKRTPFRLGVSESKVNKDLVILPKRRPQPFRFSHPGGKSSGQDYKTTSRGGYSSQRQQTGKGKFQSQRGRNWRNKSTRGKGKRQQAKSSTQE